MIKRFYLLSIFLLCVLWVVNAQNQDRPVHPSKIVTGKFLGISKPLRDAPTMTMKEFNELVEKAKTKQFNESLKLRYYPFAATALPKGPDAAWQQTMGLTSGSRAPIANFNGQDSPYYPPDANGAVGPNHYMQTINCVYAIYNKSGTLVAGPANMNTLFGSVAGSTYNDGDPVVLYDEMAGRWLATEFSISGSNNYEMIAVSATSDPTGTWYQYSFDVDDMPDYPKFGVWPDGYYMADNNSSGKDIYVFQRSQMLTGGTAQMVGFDNPYRPTSIDGFMMVPPVDNDGTTGAPAGAPGTFIAFNDDAIGGGSDQLWIYELAVNWTTPASSTFSRVQQLAVTAFSADFGSTWNNIAQLGTTMKVDAIPQIIMNVPQYRNFGSYQTIVCCHTVDVDGADHAGVRWYELRRGTQTSGNWAIRQQGTYAPDASQRWMGSVMLNGSGQIGLGYSISSSSMYPGIRYAGQSAAAYANATGTMDITESEIQAGVYYQSSYNRWGDYSDLCVDPSNDRTFWFTTEYIGSGGTRKTKIASFQFGNPPIVSTLAATSVTGTSATLNGTVNPNGISTTYYFQYGTTTSYGSTTTSTSAGSGTSAVAVTANLTGLTGGTTYHFRLTATNSDGTIYGNDFSFTPGAAVVSTTTASSITTSTASSGGNVSSDGGLAVSARGVCWSTSAGPTISGSHTSDDSGTGTFTSSLTGLLINTTYYYRAYATNSSGTYYGSELSFSTLSGIPTITTTTATSITATTATSGGNITADNGLTVTARGVCWSTSSSPTIAGSHTTNGSGIGSFTSSLTGLSPSTTYYYRAYATNSSGTYYAVQYSFTTSCGAVTVFPWTQGFENAGSIPNCWTQEQVNSSGINWTFIAGDGSTHPTAAHGGSYNACLRITSTGDKTTRLITPSLNIASLGSPTLTFYHTQQSKSGSQDILYVYYRTSSSGSWTLLTTYSSSLTSWTLATLTLPSPSSDYSIDFEGEAKNGWGICIDDITVTGTVTPTLTVTPASQNVSAAPESTSFTVTSNSSWTVSSNQGWCTVLPTSGSGSGSITATCTQNTTASARTATITTTVTGLTPATNTVVQAVPSLSVTPSSQSVTAASGSTSFSVTSNSVWTATSDQGWCTVTSGGTGSGTITANYTQNTTAASRVANITITVSGLAPIVVQVSQAAPALTVTPSNQAVTSAAGSTSFTVTSNSSWTCSSDQSWCTVTGSGTGSGTITANYTANTVVVQRVANLTVTVSGLTPIIVTVTQVAAAPALSVTPSNQAVTPQAGNTSFTVTSNTSWTATSNQGWCTVTPSGSGSGTINASYTLNNTSSSRVASITVTITGLSPVVVTVTQAAPTLSVTPSNQAVTYTSGNTSFTVTSNADWTASSNQSWCTATPSGSSSGTITATYTANNLNTTRIANVTVTVPGLTPVVVTVTQDAAPAQEFNFIIMNDVQTSDRTLEFDLYLLDTKPSVIFELAIIQAGILVNSNIINGGTITPSLVSGASELVAEQQPTNILFTTGATNGCLKMTPRTQPSCGSGTTISTTSPGTKVCRIRLTNSVAFTAGSQANLTFNFTTSPYPTKLYQFSGSPCSANSLATSGSNCFSLANNPILNGGAFLSVTPAIQSVTSGAGSTSFAVTSNVSWTASSDQSWCTVTPSGSWSGTIAANFTANTGVSSRTAIITVSGAGVTPVVVSVMQAGNPTKNLDLSVFLEGLYAGSGIMNAAMDENTYHWGETIADAITVELHSGTNYSTIVYTIPNVMLSTSGTASFTVPSIYNGNYYITIVNRNHILTTTAVPVSFSSSNISYSFDLPGKAYGDNLLLMIDGRYVIFGGDINQDGLIDSDDLSMIGNLASYAITGYNTEDITGDGLVDSSDLAVCANNAAYAIGSAVPQ
jgi:hypothetical protein